MKSWVNMSNPSKEAAHAAQVASLQRRLEKAEQTKSASATKKKMPQAATSKPDANAAKTATAADGGALLGAAKASAGVETKDQDSQLAFLLSKIKAVFLLLLSSVAELRALTVGSGKGYEGCQQGGGQSGGGVQENSRGS